MPLCLWLLGNEPWSHEKGRGKGSQFATRWKETSHTPQSAIAQQSSQYSAQCGNCSVHWNPVLSCCCSYHSFTFMLLRFLEQSILSTKILIALQTLFALHSPVFPATTPQAANRFFKTRMVESRFFLLPLRSRNPWWTGQDKIRMSGMRKAKHGEFQPQGNLLL